VVGDDAIEVDTERERAVHRWHSQVVNTFPACQSCRPCRPSMAAEHDDTRDAHAAAVTERT
jgi:hypothetical protein